MKNLLVLLLLFLWPLSGFSQGEADSLRLRINKVYSIDIIKAEPVINFKKQTVIDYYGKVLINGKKQYKYKRFDKRNSSGEYLGSSFGIYKRKEKDIIFTSQNHTVETPGKPNEYLIEFEFPAQNISFLSKKVGTFSWLAAVKLVLFEKVIDLDGKVDLIQLERFVADYKDIEEDSELYRRVEESQREN